MKYKSLYLLFPIIIFITEWAFILYLHYFQNPYQFIELSADGSFILLSGIGALVIGYFLMAYALPQHDEVNVIQINAKKTAIFVLVVSTIICLAIMISLQALSEELGGLGGYFKNPFKMRDKINKFMSYSVEHVNLKYTLSNYVISFNNVLTVIGGFLFTQKSRWRYVGIFPLIIGIVTSLITLSRFTALTIIGYWFLAFFLTIFFFDHSTANRLFKRVFRYSVVIFLVVWGFFFLIVRIRTFYLKDIGDYFDKSLIAYFIGPVSAFDVWLSKNPKLLWGESGFRSIIKWLGRFGLWDLQAVNVASNPFVRIGGGLAINTYTFVKTLYEDFGMPGVLFISLIWGGMMRWSLYFLQRKFNLFRLFLVIMLIFSLLMSFYAYYFEGLSSFVLYSLYIYFFDRLLRHYHFYQVEPVSREL